VESTAICGVIRGDEGFVRGAAVVAFVVYTCVVVGSEVNL